jgi:electron transfer flavoprotein beta subunit
VITVHPMAPVKLTYAHARRMSGHISVSGEPVAAPNAVDRPATIWTHAPVSRPLVRLKAEEKRTAHARLQAAIAVEAKGGAVVHEGSDVDKAQVVLDYLRQHRLIEF